MKSLTIYISDVAYGELVRESSLRSDSPEQLASNAVEEACSWASRNAASDRSTRHREERSDFLSPPKHPVWDKR